MYDFYNDRHVWGWDDVSDREMIGGFKEDMVMEGV